jgi:hypothetical protein
MPKGTASQEAKTFDLVAPVAQTPGTVTGTGIDCRGYEEAMINLHAGIVPSNGTLDVHLEESSLLGSGYADITEALFAQVTASTDVLPYVGRLNLKGRKRYIRAIAVVANQTIPFAVNAVLSAARELPVSQINDVAFSV